MLGPLLTKKLIINTTDFEMKLCYNVLGKKSKSAGNKLCLVLFTFDFAAFALLWGSKVAREQTR
jgi:hypothetical protein